MFSEMDLSMEIEPLFSSTGVEELETESEHWTMVPDTLAECIPVFFSVGKSRYPVLLQLSKEDLLATARMFVDGKPGCKISLCVSSVELTIDIDEPDEVTLAYSLTMVEVGMNIFICRPKNMKRTIRGAEAVGRLIKRGRFSTPLNEVPEDSVPTSIMRNLLKGETLFGELGLTGVVFLMELKCPICEKRIKTTDAGTFKSHFVPHLQRHVLAGSGNEKAVTLLRFIKAKDGTERQHVADLYRQLFGDNN